MMREALSGFKYEENTAYVIFDFDKDQRTQTIPMLLEGSLLQNRLRHTLFNSFQSVDIDRYRRSVM